MKPAKKKVSRRPIEKRCQECSYAPGGCRQDACERHCHHCRYCRSWGVPACPVHVARKLPGGKAEPHHPNYPLGRPWYRRFNRGLRNDRKAYTPAPAETPPTQRTRAERGAERVKPLPKAVRPVHAKPGALNGPSAGKREPVEGFGVPVTALLRWMGKYGWSAKQAKAVCLTLGRVPADKTIELQLKAGASGSPRFGPVPKLTKEQAARLRRMSSTTPEPEKARGKSYQVPEKLVGKAKVQGSHQHPGRHVGKAARRNGGGHDKVVKRTRDRR